MPPVRRWRASGMLVVMRRSLLLAVTVLLVAGACSSSRARTQSAGPGSTSPTVPATDPAAAVPAFPPTTPAPEPATTAPPATVAPVPAVLPKAVLSPRGVVLPVVGSEPGGLVVTTPCSGRAVVANYPAVPPVDVVLDPGHGGREKGAMGPNGLAEEDVNLAVAKATNDELTRAGVGSLLD